jgi:hypothetical protein
MERPWLHYCQLDGLLARTSHAVLGISMKVLVNRAKLFDNTKSKLLVLNASILDPYPEDLSVLADAFDVVAGAHAQ